MTAHKRPAIALAIPALCLALAISACDGDGAGPISPTRPAPPSYVLSGVVFELTPSGSVPVADAAVEVAMCPPPAFSAAVIKSVTDAAGTYQVSGLCAGTTHLWVTKDGYRTNRRGAPQCDGDCVYVHITKDTRFDVELVRE